MASDKQIVLISGGNTGVGLEVARKLLGASARLVLTVTPRSADA